MSMISCLRNVIIPGGCNCVIYVTCSADLSSLGPETLDLCLELGTLMHLPERVVPLCGNLAKH